MKIGDWVRFIDKVPGEPKLNGQTGVIESVHDDGDFHRWVVRLDNDIAGFYSGRAWAEIEELIVLEEE